MGNMVLLTVPMLVALLLILTRRDRGRHAGGRR